MSAAEHPFHDQFGQLATFENKRTPVLLLESQYNRAQACWNACADAPTEDLQQLGTGGLVALTGLTEQYRQERDQLLAEMKFVVRFHDRLTGADVARLSALTERALNLQAVQVPAAVAAEAQAIGASLDAQSLEQGDA